jgi:hypothetical protein
MSRSIRRPARALPVVAAVAALLAVGLSLPAPPPQDAPAPTPELARLVAMTGLWDVEAVLTGMPVTHGSAKLVMLGDRWLVEESRMQTDDGKTIDGRAFTGWDPAKQRYVRAWIETADARLNVVDLTWDEGQQALVSDALLMDLGQGLTSTRGVTRMPDADTIVFTATPVAPDAIPGLTVTYTRTR